MRHVGGNLTSRFTDFLTSDGEKPWRDRDGEFDEGPFTRAGRASALGGRLGQRSNAALGDAHRRRSRAKPVDDSGTGAHRARGADPIALARRDRTVGQIILLARILASDWQWITIPKGQSREYNQNPTLERPASR